MKKIRFKPNLKSKDGVCLSNSKLVGSTEERAEGSVWDAEQMLKSNSTYEHLRT